MTIIMHTTLLEPCPLFSPQEVQPNSPADLAGMKSDTDYVIGADSVLHEVMF